MSSLNQFQIIGRLGQDPEVRYIPNGEAVCNISVATSETWKDKNTGEKKEKTEWHRVVIFGKLAEVAGQYLKKGSMAFFQGKIETRMWEKDGTKHYTTELRANVMTMLGGGDGSGGSRESNNSAPRQQQAAPQQSRQAPQQQAPKSDDIPF